MGRVIFHLITDHHGICLLFIEDNVLVLVALYAILILLPFLCQCGLLPIQQGEALALVLIFMSCDFHDYVYV